jgi:hypothetical protein
MIVRNMTIRQPTSICVDVRAQRIVWIDSKLDFMGACVGAKNGLGCENDRSFAALTTYTGDVTRYLLSSKSHFRYATQLAMDDAHIYWLNVRTNYIYFLRKWTDDDFGQANVLMKNYNRGRIITFAVSVNVITLQTPYFPHRSSTLVVSCHLVTRHWHIQLHHRAVSTIAPICVCFRPRSLPATHAPVPTISACTMTHDNASASVKGMFTLDNLQTNYLSYFCFIYRIFLLQS